MFAPLSPSTVSIRELSYLVTAISAAILVVVEGVLFYSYFVSGPSHRGRRRAAQVYGSKPIEIAWTAAPALIVFVLVLVVTRTVVGVKSIPTAAAADRATTRCSSR